MADGKTHLSTSTRLIHTHTTHTHTLTFLPCMWCRSGWCMYVCLARMVVKALFEKNACNFFRLDKHRIHTHMHMYVQTDTNTYIHTYTYRHTYIRTHTYIHTHTYMHTSVHTSIINVVCECELKIDGCVVVVVLEGDGGVGGKHPRANDDTYIHGLTYRHTYKQTILHIFRHYFIFLYNLII